MERVLCAYLTSLLSIKIGNDVAEDVLEYQSKRAKLSKLQND